MITQADVHELRAAGERMPPSDTPLVLHTWPEVIAFGIHEARSHGWPILDHIELVLRAIELPREHIRHARDVLQALQYPADLLQLLTRLARKARPRPPPSFAGVGHRCG